MSNDTARTFKSMELDGRIKKADEDLPVGGLTIDPEVQRSFLKDAKVQSIVTNFDPKALGRILVSFRSPGDLSYRVLDGWHRLEAVRRLTDNEGTIPAEVYTGLTREEEASLFLNRNNGDKPNTIDRYRVSLVAGEPEATAIDAILHAYGWKVSSFTNSDGNLACVMSLRNLYRYSLKVEAEPNLVQMALLVIGKAWGTDHAAGQGHIVTAVGRVVGEYKDRLDLDRFIDKLRNYKGGPAGLTREARQFASMKKKRLPMAVAELLVEAYNVGRGEKTRLPVWSKRA